MYKNNLLNYYSNKLIITIISLQAPSCSNNRQFVTDSDMIGLELQIKLETAHTRQRKALYYNKVSRQIIKAKQDLSCSYYNKIFFVFRYIYFLPLSFFMLFIYYFSIQLLNRYISAKVLKIIWYMYGTWYQYNLNLLRLTTFFYFVIFT